MVRRRYGRTMDEIKANSIANDLFDALSRLEMFQADPEMILDSLKIIAHSTPQKGVKEAIEILRKHYCGDDK